MRDPTICDVTRRSVLVGTAAAVATPALVLVARAEGEATIEAPVVSNVFLTVNGKVEALAVDACTTLLDVLCEHLHLTGTKKGCDHGQCGACTVIVEGQRINSYLTLAILHQAEDEIQERMSGNICRCGAYSNIVSAITDIAERKA